MRQFQLPNIESCDGSSQPCVRMQEGFKLVMDVVGGSVQVGASKKDQEEVAFVSGFDLGLIGAACSYIQKLNLGINMQGDCALEEMNNNPDSLASQFIRSLISTTE